MAIPPQATALIRGSLAPKIMPRHLVDRMHGRLLLPAEAFGIGPGKAGAVDRQHSGIHSWSLECRARNAPGKPTDRTTSGLTGFCAGFRPREGRRLMSVIQRWPPPLAGSTVGYKG